MGGDYAPDIIIEGAAQSKIRYPNLNFTFFGNKETIIPLINSYKILDDPFPDWFQNLKKSD